MKRVLLILLPAVLLMSCVKNDSNGGACEPLKPSAEAAQIEAYASANSLAVTKDTPTGIYYQIIDPGTGTAPTDSSKVFVTYTGKYLSGGVFDQATQPNTTGWVLGNLIDGWRLMLPKIKKGGHIKMVLPSAYAYGCTGSGTIPPNEILFFDVTLVDVQ